MVDKQSLIGGVANQPLPVLLLDFDGTICLGDGPVLAYADAVASLLSTSEAASLHRSLAQFLANSPDAPPHKDGYAAVAAAAGTAVGAEALDSAYLLSRERLAGGTVPITAAAGLARFLDGLAGRAHRVLLTNAPLTGVAESLAMLGLSGRLDTIIPGANKPAGLAAILPRLVESRPAYEILSVGDVWANDIEPVWSSGGATAFIDRFDHRTGPASLRAPRFDLLYPGIQAWADDPAAFASNHPGTTSSPDEDSSDEKALL